LKALGLDRVHLMGTSLGGWIAAELAVRSTARLASLTLIGAVGITAGGEPIDDIFRMPDAENLRGFTPTPTGRAPSRRSCQGLRQSGRHEYRRENRATVARLAYRPASTTPVCRNGCTASTCRRFCCGAPRRSGAAQIRRRLRALIPGSRLVVLPRAGHAPFDEQKDAFSPRFWILLVHNETMRP